MAAAPGPIFPRGYETNRQIGRVWQQPRELASLQAAGNPASSSGMGVSPKGEVQSTISSYSRITCSTIALMTFSHTDVIFGAKPTSQLQLASLGSIRNGVGARTPLQSPFAALLSRILF